MGPATAAVAGQIKGNEAEATGGVRFLDADCKEVNIYISIDRSTCLRSAVEYVRSIVKYVNGCLVDRLVDRSVDRSCGIQSIVQYSIRCSSRRRGVSVSSSPTARRFTPICRPFRLPLVNPSLNVSDRSFDIVIGVRLVMQSISQSIARLVFGRSSVDRSVFGSLHFPAKGVSVSSTPIVKREMKVGRCFQCCSAVRLVCVRSTVRYINRSTIRCVLVDCSVCGRSTVQYAFGRFCFLGVTIGDALVGPKYHRWQ